jgi:hypothetical protein
VEQLLANFNGFKTAVLTLVLGSLAFTLSSNDPAWAKALLTLVLLIAVVGIVKSPKEKWKF